MENYNDEVTTASKTIAVVKCILILLLLALLVSAAGDKSTLSSCMVLFNR
jgi:hypothetical protein